MDLNKAPEPPQPDQPGLLRRAGRWIADHADDLGDVFADDLPGIIGAALEGLTNLLSDLLP